ncbi:hypothetical protein PFICI_07548 [Pestalotiopsis fici W106-1]|uniref:CCHC-type domain-containing protein n=1 Tax=Pestalotiopsis fici (strain W106-1 / CGMCC3.15140) TaxID=1229662 RepID=W3X1X6_PESFW|nr:uncharacterized protein PFICI_07548 [Pestalotiopsis fici W106-1]ETS80019.1 hypothetical protein PFICI_07548 [Pestalotiopsis fici W106-1]
MAAQTTPKGMSSRLLTMKFMQRAAASSSPASAPSTPASDDSSKRRKISHNRSNNDELEVQVDRKAIQAAIEEGERKREEALVKHAEELGDARWVLNVPNLSSSGAGAPNPLRVVQVGYAQIDSPDTSDDDADTSRNTPEKVQPIRRYNMGKKKACCFSYHVYCYTFLKLHINLTSLQTATEASDSEDDDGDSDSSNDSDASGTNSSEDEDDSESQTPSTKPRSGDRRGSYADRRSAEKARAKEFADKRRKKEVKLNNARSQPTGGLSSISGGGLSLSSGGRPMQRQSGAFAFNCHNCGEVGHKAADCKKSKKRSR